MKSVRTAVAAAALAIAVVPVTLAGCGSQPATPATTPSSTPTATAPVSPADDTGADPDAYEVEVVTAAGQHRYVVAIDINAAQHN